MVGTACCLLFVQTRCLRLSRLVGAAMDEDAVEEAVVEQMADRAHPAVNTLGGSNKPVSKFLKGLFPSDEVSPGMVAMGLAVRRSWVLALRKKEVVFPEEAPP